MNLLTPLGLIGLISLIALIIIYIIKPNYQNKIISSTFVWKLSLKYKKKSIPINKLRNILIFICQVLILALSSLMLAGPYIDTDTADVKEHVLIIDASASMMAETANKTRFEEAVRMVEADTRTLLASEDVRVSVILAAKDASFVVQRADKTALSQISDSLNALVEGDTKCTWGYADIDGAMALAEEITAYNAGASVTLYSDTDYIDKNNVSVKKIRDINDYNAAILDVRAVNVENYYRFEIDVACYGRNSDLRVYLDISGVNESLDKLPTITADVRCVDGEVVTLCFGKALEDETDIKIIEDLSVTEFSNVYVHIDEADSLERDNSFYLYGGRQETLRIQYKSETPNKYVRTALLVLRNQLKYRWDIEFVELMPDEEAATEGFDLYIFEHEMPTTLPKDGVVFLINPDKAPAGSGFMLGGERRFPLESAPYLTAGDPHKIIDSIEAANIQLTRFREITSSDGFDNLLYCEGKPVLIAKNDMDAKIAVMSFSLHYSDFALLDFPIMLYNLIEYYIPSTITDHVFEVGDTVSLNCRGEALTVSGPGVDKTETEFPLNITVSEPGSYNASQETITGKTSDTNFFVRIPMSESNINATEDTLTGPFFLPAQATTDIYLLFYFAMALVALLLVEWWLHTREQY